MSEIRYDTTVATKEMVRDASKPHDGELAQCQENLAIFEKLTAMWAEVSLGNGMNKHSDGHGQQ